MPASDVSDVCTESNTFNKGSVLFLFSHSVALMIDLSFSTFFIEANNATFLLYQNTCKNVSSGDLSEIIYLIILLGVCKYHDVVSPMENYS